MPKNTKKSSEGYTRIEKNGIARPKPGSKTSKVWDIAEKLAAKSNVQNVERADVFEKGVAAGLNEATIATQFQNWRVFNGLAGHRAGRKAAPKKAAAKKAAPAKKTASKKAPAKKTATKRTPKPKAETAAVPPAPPAPPAEVAQAA